MAQNTTYDIAAKTWVLLTNSDVTEITFQNVSESDIWIKATADTTAPTTMGAALKYPPSMGERKMAVASLFPGLTEADRIWAYCDDPASVMVSHA